MLKNKLLIICIGMAFLGYNASFAQVSNRIVDTNKQWSMMSYIPWGVIGDESICMVSKHIKFSGDSLIDSTRYKKVYEAEDSLANNWSLTGFIRETNKKVYGRTLDDDQEYLMYDFDVKVNDTIQVADPFVHSNYLEFVVTNMDSISLINTKKKRITLTNVNEEDIKELWIEGIGSKYGGVIYRQMNLIGTNKTLLCFKENGILQYDNPNFAKCYYEAKKPLNINDVKAQNDILVYPNPFEDQVCIASNKTFLHLNQVSFRLYSLDWRLLKEQQIALNDRTCINLSQINPGAYIYMIFSENNLHKAGKLIKQ